MTLQHRTALAGRQFWNLKAQLRSPCASSPGGHSRTPKGRRDLDTLCETVQGNQIRVRHNGAARRREKTNAKETMVGLAFENLQGCPCARAEAMGFLRADKMAGHPIKCYISCWKCATSLGGGTTKDAGEAIHIFTHDRALSDAVNNTSTIIGTNAAWDGKRWRKTDPNLTSA